MHYISKTREHTIPSHLCLPMSDTESSHIKTQENALFWASIVSLHHLVLRLVSTVSKVDQLQFYQQSLTGLKHFDQSTQL